MIEPTAEEWEMANVIALDRTSGLALRHQIAQALAAHHHALTEPTPARMARLAKTINRHTDATCDCSRAAEFVLRALREEA